MEELPTIVESSSKDDEGNLFTFTTQPSIIERQKAERGAREFLPSGSEEVDKVKSVKPPLRTVEFRQKQKQKQEGQGSHESGQWVIDIKRSLERNHTFDGGKSWSIYRVPARLRQIQESAFSPKLVSIGPFHLKDNNLQAGNEHKMRFLVRLLGGKFEKYDENDADVEARRRHGDQIIDEDCSVPLIGIELAELEMAMKFLENNARACYSEAFNDITSDEFVRMMVLDGCFIIEVLRFYYNKSKRYIRDTAKDPIFHSHWMIQTLASDLLMFENQLPLFVLQQLFSLTTTEGGVELVTLCRFFFNSLTDPKKMGPPLQKAHQSDNYDHLLHLFLWGFTSRLQGTKYYRSEIKIDVDDPSFIKPKKYKKLSYHAREIQEAGVEIVKRKLEDEGLLGIDYINDGELRMHPLYLDDMSALMLLNFVAFEQSCHRVIRPYFSNYIVFLDGLIDNECDVEVLHKAGVLNHAFGNNNDVAYLINKVGREIVCDPNYNYLHCDMDALNAFCKSYYASKVRTWWRNLIITHFSTPWTTTSFLAAVILLILTLIQTYYAIS